MIVTEVAPFGAKRYRVSLDTKDTFVLYKKEVQTFRIAEGQELSEASREEIFHTLLPKRACLRAMNLLKSRPYTEYQIREKLGTGGYPESVIDEAVSYVKSYHYIDDMRYARDYAEYHSAGKSRMRIRQDLGKKGIDKETIAAALDEVYAGEAGPDKERALVEKELAKRHFDPQTATYEERQRLMAHLYRKGFSADLIRSVLEADA